MNENDQLTADAMPVNRRPYWLRASTCGGSPWLYCPSRVFPSSLANFDRLVVAAGLSSRVPAPCGIITGSN